MSTSDFNTGQFNWRFYASNIRSNPGQNLILDASGSSNLSMTTNGTERFRVSDSSSVFFTNLDISGNGLRLRGDFSSGISSRLCLQSYVPNGNSLVGIIPNGTATIGRLTLFNTSDPANAGAFVIESTSTSNNITSSFTGTGTTKRLVLSYSGGGSITLDTSANFSTAPNCDASANSNNQLVNWNNFFKDTFTPSLISTLSGESVAYSTRSGVFNRIGNMVFFLVRIVVSSITGSGGGSVRISLGNLPVSGSFTIGVPSAVTFNLRNTGSATTIVSASGIIGFNSREVIVLVRTAASASDNPLGWSSIGNSFECDISGTYFTS